MIMTDQCVCTDSCGDKGEVTTGSVNATITTEIVALVVWLIKSTMYA